MGYWWYRNIIEPGKLPMLLSLASFVVTSLATRTITRLIRAGRGPFGNISQAGLHIHHVVPGVVLVVIGGFGAVGSGQHGVASAVCAVVFGIGVGLVLDEFALIVHIDDVYWSEQGRKSVEVVVLAAALAVNFLLVLITFFKGELPMWLLGTLVPFVAVFGAIRLARSGSPWGRRFYCNRPKARAKIRLRSFHHDRRWDRPRHKLQDFVGGAPDRLPVRGG
ncbi:hypothetical protein ACFVXW_39555 [Streptomyces sp. NPDC058251]|uniref:hypothetical protein n=1 Tax=Streptomyces sp. NPDC058251 TaxID=3346404 RepID=UPI0036EE5231